MEPLLTEARAAAPAGRTNWLPWAVAGGTLAALGGLYLLARQQAVLPPGVPPCPTPNPPPSQCRPDCCGGGGPTTGGPPRSCSLSLVFVPGALGGLIGTYYVITGGTAAPNGTGCVARRVAWPMPSTCGLLLPNCKQVSQAAINGFQQGPEVTDCALVTASARGNC